MDRFLYKKETVKFLYILGSGKGLSRTTQENPIRKNNDEYNLNKTFSTSLYTLTL